MDQIQDLCFKRVGESTIKLDQKKKHNENCLLVKWTSLDLSH